MAPVATPKPPSPILYPESDGLPMADNTKQLRWIVLLFGNLEALYREHSDVFVAGNLLWYPEEGQPELRYAPDVFVVFGRPKGDRGSYKQWEEGNVPMTVVFEVLSPETSGSEMIDKYAFYEEHGVEEYYVYDPNANRLHIYVRCGEALLRQRQVHGFVSPRLGIRFDLSGPEMVVHHPDGRPFLSFAEHYAALQHAERRTAVAEWRVTAAEGGMTRLAELSRKARRQQATSEELAELDRLEEGGLSFAP